MTRDAGSGPTIAVLGASGLIGQALTEALGRDGFAVVAVARSFTRAQGAAFGKAAVTCPVADLDEARLARLLDEHGIDVVVNCIGVLQDGPRGDTRLVHQGFVERLLGAIASRARPLLLIHVSIPGREEEDATPFARTKRAGEHLIRASGVPFVILRPGFVIAPAAYGGSALVRACAALPVRLPDDVTGRPFAAIGMEDIARTVAAVARRWHAGERVWDAAWDLVSSQPSTVGDTIESMRQRFGGPPARLRMPVWLLHAGAWAGDGVARLGWSPPVRTTALREMLRGVSGRPEAWMAATGIAPASLEAIVAALPSTIQERWFARLFPAKPAIIGSLAVFWIASGAIVLTVAFAPASAILVRHGFAMLLADMVTVLSSLADMAIGLAIAVRRTCRAGLLAGIATSLFYMASAALITPDLWVEPLGALVKTLPAIVLMAVALMVLDDR